MSFFQDLELRKELEKKAHELSQDQKVIELVKVMSPMDIVGVIQHQLTLKPKQALYLYANVLKNSIREFNLGIETNKQYPVPNKKDSDMQEDYVNTMPAYVVSNFESPPAPRKSNNFWPFDSNTKNAMDPHSKERRPLMQSKVPSNDPGQGTFQKNQPQNPTGNMSDTGGSITTRGYPGLSSSPQNKEYDMPEEREA